MECKYCKFIKNCADDSNKVHVCEIVHDAANEYLNEQRCSGAYFLIEQHINGFLSKIIEKIQSNGDNYEI